VSGLKQTSCLQIDGTKVRLMQIHRPPVSRGTVPPTKDLEVSVTYPSPLHQLI